MSNILIWFLFNNHSPVVIIDIYDKLHYFYRLFFFLLPIVFGNKLNNNIFEHDKCKKENNIINIFSF